LLSTASKATKIIVKAINASITDWLIVTIPKNDRDKVMLCAIVKAVTTLIKFMNPLTKKIRHIKKRNAEQQLVPFIRSVTLKDGK